MATDPADDAAMLEAARGHCRRLVDRLRRDAQSLSARSPALGEEALAQGRAAFDKAEAAAERLLRLLEDGPRETP